MPRPQFSLKTLLALMTAAAVIACVAGFVLRLKSNLGRFYDGFTKASAEARAQGKDLTFNEWKKMYETEMAKKREQAEGAGP